MSPHRRRCFVNAILEIKGSLVGITGEALLKMSDDELVKLYDAIGRAMESTLITEPAAGPRIETVDTILMEAIDISEDED